MKFSLLLAAAGHSKRMGGGVNKLFLPVCGEALFIRSLRPFAAFPQIGEWVIVAAQEHLEEMREQVSHCFPDKPVKWVVGGKERQESVRLGLQQVEGEYVLVHDGARPLVSRVEIGSLLDALSRFEAAILAVPVKETVKVVAPDGRIASTPPRDRLWAAQTPQGFRTNLLLRANEAARKQGLAATDDASLVEALGEVVHIVPGSYSNVKLTTPEDVVWIEALVQVEGGGESVSHRTGV